MYEIDFCCGFLWIFLGSLHVYNTIITALKWVEHHHHHVDITSLTNGRRRSYCIPNITCTYVNLNHIIIVALNAELLICVSWKVLE